MWCVHIGDLCVEGHPRAGEKSHFPAAFPSNLRPAADSPIGGGGGGAGGGDGVGAPAPVIVCSVQIPVLSPSAVPSSYPPEDLLSDNQENPQQASTYVARPFGGAQSCTAPLKLLLMSSPLRQLHRREDTPGTEACPSNTAFPSGSPAGSLCPPSELQSFRSMPASHLQQHLF